MARPLISTKRTARGRWRRRGAVYIAELLLVMPVLMVLFLAVVQFGVFFSSLQMLSFASRVGAEAASETALPATGDVPISVSSVVNQHLASCNLSQCGIHVVHFGGALATPTYTLTFTGGSGTPFLFGETIANGGATGTVTASDEGPEGSVSYNLTSVAQFAPGDVITGQTSGATATVDAVGGICDCSPKPLPTPPPGLQTTVDVTTTSYVRVTVCARLTQMMPNLLAPFGYDISGDDQVVSCATTMQSEVD